MWGEGWGRQFGHLVVWGVRRGRRLLPLVLLTVAIFIALHRIIAFSNNQVQADPNSNFVDNAPQFVKSVFVDKSQRSLPSRQFDDESLFADVPTATIPQPPISPGNLTASAQLHRDTCVRSEQSDWTETRAWRRGQKPIDLSQPSWTKFSGVVLVVTFNEPVYSVIPHLEILYRPFFHQIVYCGPKPLDLARYPALLPYSVTFVTYGSTTSKPNPNPKPSHTGDEKFPNVVNNSLYSTKSPKDFRNSLAYSSSYHKRDFPRFSPPHPAGSFNYECLSRVLRSFHTIPLGYLVIADDLLPLLPTLSSAPRDLVWFVPPEEVRIGDLTILRECRLGSCDFHPRGRWHWWEDYREATMEALEELRGGGIRRGRGGESEEEEIRKGDGAGRWWGKFWKWWEGVEGGRSWEAVDAPANGRQGINSVMINRNTDETAAAANQKQREKEVAAAASENTGINSAITNQQIEAGAKASYKKQGFNIASPIKEKRETNPTATNSKQESNSVPANQNADTSARAANQILALYRRCHTALVRLNGAEMRANGAYSDIYYIPHSLATPFSTLASLFLSHRVFLEIAVPTILRCLVHGGAGAPTGGLIGEGNWGAEEENGNKERSGPVMGVNKENKEIEKEQLGWENEKHSLGNPGGIQIGEERPGAQGEEIWGQGGLKNQRGKWWSLPGRQVWVIEGRDDVWKYFKRSQLHEKTYLHPTKWRRLAVKGVTDPIGDLTDGVLDRRKHSGNESLESVERVKVTESGSSYLVTGSRLAESVVNGTLELVRVYCEDVLPYLHDPLARLPV